jgi:hypothetical protein
MRRNILEPWATGGFSESLDSLIFRKIIKPLSSASDKVFMFQNFIDQGFFSGPDWQNSVNFSFQENQAAFSGNIPTSEKHGQVPPLETFYLDDIVKLLYGPGPSSIENIQKAEVIADRRIGNLSKQESSIYSSKMTDDSGYLTTRQEALELARVQEGLADLFLEAERLINKIK